MASQLNRQIIRARQEQLLRDLLVSPLNVQQILALSATYVAPFTTVEYVRKYMRRLQAQKLVSAFCYHTNTCGAESYFKVTRNAFRELQGIETRLPPRCYFTATSRTLEPHVRETTDFMVRTRVAAQHTGIEIQHWYGDGQIVLKVGEARRKPDGAFSWKRRGARPERFLHEHDRGTEPIVSDDPRESLVQKLDFYYALERSCRETFRVLFTFSHASPRIRRFLEVARERNPDPRRRIVLAAVLDEYLAHGDPLRWPIMLDHDGNPISLVSSPSGYAPQEVTRPVLDELVFA